MLQLVTLILPTIFPSWRFFKEVEASPRLEWRGTDSGEWAPAVPRPRRLSTWRALRGLFWNPHWNEYLFLVSCCERLLVAPSQHSLDEIVARLTRRHGCTAEALQFRILVEDGGRVRPVVYESQFPHVL